MRFPIPHDGAWGSKSSGRLFFRRSVFGIIRMMNINEKNPKKEWYVRTEDGRVYGPADIASLVEWAKDGRVDPSAFLSRDRIEWMPAQLMPELEMKWLVELEPGNIIGPYNRAYLVSATRDGSLASDANVYRLHEFDVEQDPPPVIVEKEVIKEVPVEKIVEKEVIKEVPVEKIVEKEVIKEVPVEKIVEKIVEVPVEKIVEKEVVREVPVEKIVEKIVEKEVIKEVPVEKIVEKIVEVEKPPRTTVVVPEVVEPTDETPPRPIANGIFGGASRSSLAALEAQARRELAAAGKGRFGIFGRKRQ